MQTQRGLAWDARRANAVVREQLADSVSLSEFLDSLKKKNKLSRETRLLLVEQAQTLLEMNYVHLALKQALHAVDPVRLLQLLKIQIENTKESNLPDEMQFHRKMLEIFTSTRDLHTNYLLPPPFDDKVAFLPFLIEEYFDDGDEEPKYLVSRVADGFRHPYFKPGVEVRYWNGVPIRRAIELNGENQAGSNLDARFARGLDRLTIRPLIVSLPPDEAWVVISFCTEDDQEMELKHEWRVLTEDVLLPLFSGRGRRRRLKKQTKGVIKASVDIQKNAINQVRKLLFAPKALAAEIKARNENKKVAHIRNMMLTTMPGVFRARTVRVDDMQFGYIRIFTFAINDVDGFVREFVRLAGRLPQNGLIIDVRGNGGGTINAGEQLLQLLTPHSIKPELFEFRSTRENLELCRQFSDDVFDLPRWAKSIEQALVTGAQYSIGVPLTAEKSCNDIGQVYYGPVLLITDALCYSTTDMFAAGFQDHEIGPVLGASGNTGAGGANVWEHEQLVQAGGEGATTLSSLPGGARMRVALLRSIRVGKNAGRPLEELGVVPDRLYSLTRDDVLSSNTDLIRHAANILSKRPVRQLTVKVSKTENAGRRTITVTTRKIFRLHAYLDGQPFLIARMKEGKTEFEIRISRTRPKRLKLEGYNSGGKLVAAARIDV